MPGKRKAPHLLTQGEGLEGLSLVGEAYHSPPLPVKRFTVLAGGKAAVPPHPTPVHFKGAGVGGPAAHLPCLYVNNVISKGKRKGDFGRKRSNENPILSSDRKAGESLFLNASALLARGVDRCAFVTITTPENLSYWTMEGWREARERFRSWTCNKSGLAYVFGECDWCRVIEPQKRGAIHWHLLLDTGQDIRTGCDFEAFNLGDYRTAPPALRGMWARMRESAKRYKLGRVEIMPTKSDKWEAAARYCGKYICKGVKREQWEKFKEQKERPAHTRRVGFSRGGWRVANPNFAWIEQGTQWREAVALFAEKVGAQTMQELSEILGKKWAFYCHENIWDCWEMNHSSSPAVS